MSDTAILLAIFDGGSSSRTHLTDALIFASRSILCAVVSIMPTELAKSILIGAWPISVLVEDGKSREIKGLEGDFNDPGWSAGVNCGKGRSLELIWWRVVLMRLRRVSLYCGPTIIKSGRQGTLVKKLRWALTRDVHTGYTTITGKYFHRHYTVSFEELISNWFGKRVYFAFGPYFFVVRSLVFQRVHELIISSENNDYGHWSSQAFRAETWWFQYQAHSPFPRTTLKISWYAISRISSPELANGVAIHGHYTRGSNGIFQGKIKVVHTRLRVADHPNWDFRFDGRQTLSGHQLLQIHGVATRARQRNRSLPRILPRWFWPLLLYIRILSAEESTQAGDIE